MLKLVFVLFFTSWCDWWYNEIPHRGKSPFADEDYVIFRNVKEYGAKGDGVTDDTDAINNAVSVQGRCGEGCQGTTTTPAILYFPPGRYIVSSMILNYYYTQIVGDANDLPTIKATADLKGNSIINGNPGIGPTLVFYREVRNVILDMTSLPLGTGTGIHWEVSQATHLQNVRIEMTQNKSADNKQRGIEISQGSGGYMGDIVIVGGGLGFQCGNQQFTCRNLTFINNTVGFTFSWGWGWSWFQITFVNCNTGADVSNDGLGDIELVDCIWRGCNVGIVRGNNNKENQAIIIENGLFVDTTIAFATQNGQVLLEGNRVVRSYVHGVRYEKNNSVDANGRAQPNRTPIEYTSENAPPKPESLLGPDGQSFFYRARPQYEDVSSRDFLSIRAGGAVGDAKTDDSDVIQRVINTAAERGGNTVVFIDFGVYLIGKTILIPPNVRITGECWPSFVAHGSVFQDELNPVPMLKVGNPGDTGFVEISDLVVGVQGPQPGAILIEWNIRPPEGSKGTVGVWDFHARISGWHGGEVNDGEKASFMGVHVGKTGSVYMESMWIWQADHTIDSGGAAHVYSGRGVLIEGGPVWLIGPGSEHFVLYQFEIANAAGVLIGLAQSETAYYQPDPRANEPFTIQSDWYDPDFSECQGDSNLDFCIKGYGLRVINSSNVFLFGGGFYSFFGCNGDVCQRRMVHVDDESKNINLYGVNTIHSERVIDWVENGKEAYAAQSDDGDTYAETVAYFRQP